MATVPALLLEGLAEGLTLRSIEREEASRADLTGRIETMLGQRPSEDQLGPVLDRLTRTDRLRLDDAHEPPVYRLTQEGARRLMAYRRLPDALGATLVSLFRLDGALDEDAPRIPSQPAAPAPRSTPASAPTAPLDPARVDVASTGWVREALAALPASAEIQARHAHVSLDREPARQRWTLTVEQHDPGGYQGAGACPLTFLYEAAVRLIYGVGPDAEPPPAPTPSPAASSRT